MRHFQNAFGRFLSLLVITIITALIITGCSKKEEPVKKEPVRGSGNVPSGATETPIRTKGASPPPPVDFTRYISAACERWHGGLNYRAVFHLR